MLKMRDKYLHTNCLAALANMSGQFRSLHPYVAQRLVSLFETLAKKHARLADMNGVGDESITVSGGGGGSGSGTESGGGGSGSRSTIIATDATVRSMVLEDLSVLEEVLRMVLEIINSCISHQLVYCPNLVYTLLYKRQVFEAFRSHSAFQDIIQNIDMVKKIHPFFFQTENRQEIIKKNDFFLFLFGRSLDSFHHDCNVYKSNAVNWA